MQSNADGKTQPKKINPLGRNSFQPLYFYIPIPKVFCHSSVSGAHWGPAVGGRAELLVSEGGDGGLEGGGGGFLLAPEISLIFSRDSADRRRMVTLQNGAG